LELRVSNDIEGVIMAPPSFQRIHIVKQLKAWLIVCHCQFGKSTIGVCHIKLSPSIRGRRGDR
jgi:hypothetical protein